MRSRDAREPMLSARARACVRLLASIATVIFAAAAAKISKCRLFYSPAATRPSPTPRLASRAKRETRAPASRRPCADAAAARMPWRPAGARQIRRRVREMAAARRDQNRSGRRAAPRDPAPDAPHGS